MQLSRPTAGLVLVAALVAGCSSGSSDHSASSRTTPTTASASARWTSAYAFLDAQTKPTEIACSWFALKAGKPSPSPKAAQFFDFTDTAAWKSHLITRVDPQPTGDFEDCEATVPTTVPYGPAIETFLGRYGLAFAGDPDRPKAATPVEIAYAGQDASDPDIVFHDKPGLFGLRIALAQLGDAPFQPGTSKIVQPADEATAAEYLRYATPLLDWYGYKA